MLEFFNKIFQNTDWNILEDLVEWLLLTNL